MKVVLLIWIFLFIPISAMATSGCCSWHGGVDYCASNGRIVCKDGTYSPSCTCNSSNNSNYLTHANESNQQIPSTVSLYVEGQIEENRYLAVLTTRNNKDNGEKGIDKYDKANFS
jgi:hypothetical protein